MQKAEHGKRVREAMARKGISRTALADAVNKNVKTVTNWRTGTTLPDETDRALLRKVLGPYDAQGDPVEVAVLASELTEDRAYHVIGYYKGQLREQRGEATA